MYDNNTSGAIKCCKFLPALHYQCHNYFLLSKYFDAIKSEAKQKMWVKTKFHCNILYLSWYSILKIQQLLGNQNTLSQSICTGNKLHYQSNSILFFVTHYL